MDDSTNDSKKLGEDINTLQLTMIENTLIVKKELSSSLQPVISLTAVISVVVLGLFISIGSTFVNILVAIILALIAVTLVVLRYFFFVRSTSSVINHLNSGVPLKDEVEVPILNKLFTFLSPVDVYETVLDSVDEEWVDLIPVLEEELSKIYELKESKKSN